MDQLLIAKHHHHYEVAQMHILTVYLSHDKRYKTKVIQGYKIEYKPNYKGEDINYHRFLR